MMLKLINYLTNLNYTKKKAIFQLVSLSDSIKNCHISQSINYKLLKQKCHNKKKKKLI